MQGMQRRVVAALLVVSACREPRPSPLATPAPGSGPPVQASAALAPAGRPTPRPASTTPPPPEVAITVTGPGEFEVAGAASLSALARIEKADGDAWKPLEHLDLGRGYRLDADCAEHATCVSADPPIVPVPWRGFDCSAQCNMTCRANVWLGPGRFRLTVTACDGRATFAGPDFELADSAHIPSTERVWAARDVVDVEALRLTMPPEPWDGAAPARADRVAGFAASTDARPLDEGGIATLGSLLRSESGFDDQVAKRCSMDHIVGMRLRHRLPTTGAPREQRVEIAMDFKCQKLFVVWDGAKRHVHATHFDPSRAAFLALAKRALPGDAEIAALR